MTGLRSADGPMSGKSITGRCTGMLLACLLVGLLGPTGNSGVSTARAAGAAPLEGFATPAFRNLWQHDDGTVALGRATRTWLWGPGSFFTNYEPYTDATEGNHLTQYFDKGRMEINRPEGDQSAPWYVTSGLLVREMVSGLIQTGDTQTFRLGPAEIPVAGDAASGSPGYAAFSRLTGPVASREGQAITQEVSAAGTVSNRLAPIPLKYGYFEKVTGHNWAEAFWAFAHSATRPASFDWVHTLGYPITDPYWVRTVVNGAPQSIVVQLFERRTLTYNPSNPTGTEIEMGNVGRHYYKWRYANAHIAEPGASYEVKITVGPAPLRMTRLDETVAFTNRTGASLDRAVLHAVWHNWDGVFTLRGVDTGGTPLVTQWLQGINLEVAFPHPLEPGAHTEIHLAADLKPRPVGGRTGYDRTNDVLCLGDMLPTLVPWQNGGWSYYPYSDLGDLGFYATSNYSVEIVSTGNERLIVGGTGKIASVDAARTHWNFTAPNVRDVAYVVSPRFIDPLVDPGMARTQGSIRVLAYFLPWHRAEGQRQLDLVSPALGWFGERIGPYPFDTYTIAEMGVPLERTDNYAQEYPMAYFVPTPWLRYGTAPGTWTWYTPVHEVGHQWFYSTVGNNQLTDPWLDEAMTSYVTAEYVRANFPNQYGRAWESISGGQTTPRPVSAGVFSGFNNENEYSATIYNKGVRMLQRVRTAMGDTAFYAGLRQYYQDLRFKIATPSDVIRIMQAHTNADLSAIFSGYLAH